VSDDKMAPRMPRRGRRLSDHILIAFHQACDQGDLEVAGLLLKVLEMMIAAPRLPHPGGDRRRETETLVAAHERLWQLRHPEPVV
jgi:hypothetical protein